MRRSLGLATPFLAGLVAVATLSRPALAQEAQPSAAQPSATVANNEPEEVVAADDPQRTVSLEPKAAEPPAEDQAMFVVDPVADTALIVVFASFTLVLEFINATGEIRPQQIAADFDSDDLLAIDRPSIERTPDDSAVLRSNTALGAALLFAVVDPVLTGIRERSVQAGLVDATLYAESTLLTLAITDIVKMAVRRPRPGAYADAEEHQGDPNYSNADTDSALSFFSGHASVSAAIGATATYLAFARSPRTARPWITLALATGLTTFVSIERVRAGDHFPTDVIAGAIAGAGIGVVVPHTHRSDEVKQRRVWGAFTPLDGPQGARGGTVSLGGMF